MLVLSNDDAQRKSVRRLTLFLDSPYSTNNTLSNLVVMQIVHKLEVSIPYR